MKRAMEKNSSGLTYAHNSNVFIVYLQRHNLLPRSIARPQDKRKSKPMERPLTQYCSEMQYWAEAQGDASLGRVWLKRHYTDMCPLSWALLWWLKKIIFCLISETQVHIPLVPVMPVLLGHWALKHHNAAATQNLGLSLMVKCPKSGLNDFPSPKHLKAVVFCFSQSFFGPWWLAYKLLHILK